MEVQSCSWSPWSNYGFGRVILSCCWIMVVTPSWQISNFAWQALWAIVQSTHTQDATQQVDPRQVKRGVWKLELMYRPRNKCPEFPCNAAFRLEPLLLPLRFHVVINILPDGAGLNRDAGGYSNVPGREHRLLSPGHTPSPSQKVCFRYVCPRWRLQRRRLFQHQNSNWQPLSSAAVVVSEPFPTLVCAVGTACIGLCEQLRLPIFVITLYALFSTPFCFWGRDWIETDAGAVGQ